MQYEYEKVRLGTKRLSPFNLLTRGRNHYAQIAGVPVFSALQPLLPELQAACDRLNTAMLAFDNNAGPWELHQRDVAYGALKNVINRVGGGVQSCSNGDPAIILASGFDLKLKRQPSQPMQAPARVRAMPTHYPGEIRVQWGAVKNRSLYRVWYTASDPTIAEDWQLLTMTTKNYFLADGLESDHTYTFRVTALGARGESPLSDISTAKAV